LRPREKNNCIFKTIVDGKPASTGKEGQGSGGEGDRKGEELACTVRHQIVPNARLIPKGQTNSKKHKQ